MVQSGIPEDVRAFHNGPYVCRICRLGLEHEVMFLAGKPVAEAWSHNGQHHITDHDPDPMALDDFDEQRSVCDFCGVMGPVWEFPCGDFTTPLPNKPTGETQSYTSVENWYACEPCKDYVEREDWNAVWSRWMATHGDDVADTSSERLLELKDKIINDIWIEGFWAHRLGEPVSILTRGPSSNR